MKPKSMLLLLPIMVVLSSCTAGTDTNIEAGQLDYDQTKKMVVDILKTDDGKKAIQDVVTDDKTKQALIMNQKVVSDTIEKTLTSDKAVDFWKQTFSDPAFAKTVATNMRSENEKLLKDLMNDPQYRAMMIQVFKEPEIQKEMTDALKTKEYRQQIQTVITETMNSPLFKAKMQDLIQKAADDIKNSTTKSGS